MNSPGDFEIEDGVLIRYRGAERGAEIPVGVTEIADRAFEGCSCLQSVIVPDGVTRIGSAAFQNCANLQCVTLPGSVTHVGDDAFRSCARLAAVTIPVGAFRKSCFAGCASVRFCFTPKRWMRTAQKLPRILLDYLHPSDVAAADIAWLLLCQDAAEWQSCVSMAVSFGGVAAQSVVRAAADALDRGEAPLRSAGAKRLYAFVLKYRAKISAQDVQALRDVCLKSSARAVCGLDWDAIVSADAGAGGAALKRLVSENDRQCCFAAALTVASDSLPYADGSGCAPRSEVAALLAEYAYLYERVADGGCTAYGNGAGDLCAPQKLSVSETADLIAEKLDRAALSGYLLTLVQRANYRPWLLSFTRFAVDADVRSFCGTLSGRTAKERCRRDNALAALYLSDTRSAIQYLDKAGKLEDYARFRGTDADTLRGIALSDFGLDADGKKTYDLGGTTVTASLRPDLTLSLFDAGRGKAVKSIPRAGGDKALTAAASADLADLKKNIRSAAEACVGRLYADFLSGKAQKSRDWRAVYLTNPLLRQLAGLLVWAQGGRTFTLSGKSAILSDGTSYAITDEPIRLARPAEMTPEEIELWRRYFDANTLRQPFAQLRTPAP